MCVLGASQKPMALAQQVVRNPGPCSRLICGGPPTEGSKYIANTRKYNANTVH